MIWVARSGARSTPPAAETWAPELVEDDVTRQGSEHVAALRRRGPEKPKAAPLFGEAASVCVRNERRYQLAFLTPGILPSRDISLNAMRESPNFWR